MLPSPRRQEYLLHSLISVTDEGTHPGKERVRGSSPDRYGSYWRTQLSSPTLLGRERIIRATEGLSEPNQRL